MCCECHFMLTLSNIVVLPVMYVECTLLYLETVFTHQPWQQCTCCHAHHSQTHGHRQEGRSGVCPSDCMSKAETHANKSTFDCDWQRAGKDQREVYFTCTLFNLLLLSFRPLCLLILLSTHLFLDSLVEERGMFLRPSVSSEHDPKWMIVCETESCIWVFLWKPLCPGGWFLLNQTDFNNFFVLCRSH